ncbi:hypothetical protein BBH56_09490 [Spiribacter roseus]|nr:hypothetical protein BBH56_09490 [Spiribacter roseus]
MGLDVTAAESFDIKSTATDKVQSNTDAPGDVEHSALSNNFGSADLKLGYNWVSENGLYVGFAANYNLNGIDENFDKDSDGDTVGTTKEDAYGAEVKLGAAVSDSTAFYGIVGYQSADFKLSINTPEGSTNDKQSHSGVRYGIGATYAITENILLSAEATQTDYDSKDYLDGQYKVEAKETEFGLGIAYRFGL